MRFLVAIIRPDGYDPSTEDAAMHKAIDSLNDEMIAAGVRLFVGGLYPPESATSIRFAPNGELLLSKGQYLPTSEHVGGFWVLETRSEEDAIDWARRAALACRAPVEVRRIY